MTATATPKMIELVRFIVGYQAKHGCSPTLRECAEHEGINKVTIHERAQCMIRRGLLRRAGEKNWARTLVPTNEALELVGAGKCPCCGGNLTKP